MKLCWVEDSEKPGLDTLETLLTHLYTNKDATPADNDDVERRWQTLYPDPREHNLPFTNDSKCSLKFESNFVPEVCVQDHTLKRDSLLFSLNSEQLPNEIPSHESFTIDYDAKLRGSVSPSLQNLRGSIEELSEQDTKAEQILTLQPGYQNLEDGGFSFLDVGESSSSTELTHLIASNEHRETHNTNVTVVEETLLPLCSLNETAVVSSDLFQNVAVSLDQEIMLVSASTETHAREIEHTEDFNNYDEPDNEFNKTFPSDKSEKSDLHCSQLTNTIHQGNSGKDNILSFSHDTEKEFFECIKSGTESFVDGSSMNIFPASHSLTRSVTSGPKSSSTELCQTGCPTTDTNQVDSSHTSSEKRSQPTGVGDKSWRTHLETTLPNFPGKDSEETIASEKINNDLSVLKEVNGSTEDDELHLVLSKEGCTLFDSSRKESYITESDCSTGWESNKKEPNRNTQSSKIRHDSTDSTRMGSGGDDPYVKYNSTVSLHSIEEKPTSILHLCLDKETGERCSCLENPGIPFSITDCCYSNCLKVFPATKAKEIVSLDGLTESEKEQLRTSMCKFGSITSCGEKEMFLGPNNEMRTKVGDKPEQTCVTVDDIKLSFSSFDSENIDSPISSFTEHYKIKNPGICLEGVKDNGGRLDLSCETLKFSMKEIQSPALDSGDSIITSSDKQQRETPQESNSNPLMSKINTVSSGHILLERSSEQDNVYGTVQEDNTDKLQDELEGHIVFENKLESPKRSNEGHLLTSETHEDFCSNKPFTIVGDDYNGLSDNENHEQSFSTEKDQVNTDQKLEELIDNNIFEQSNQEIVSSSFEFLPGEPNSEVTEKESYCDCEPLNTNMEESGASEEVDTQGEDISMFEWSNQEVASSSFEFHSTQPDEQITDTTAISSADREMEGNEQTIDTTTISSAYREMEGDEQITNATTISSTDHEMEGDEQAIDTTTISSAYHEMEGDEQITNARTISSADHEMEGDEQTIDTTTISSADHEMEGNDCGSFEDNIQVSVNDILDDEVKKLKYISSLFNQSNKGTSLLELHSVESNNQEYKVMVDKSSEPGQHETLEKEVSCTDTVDNSHYISIEESHFLPFQSCTEAEGPDREVLDNSFTEDDSLQDRMFQHHNMKDHVPDEPSSGFGKFLPVTDSNVVNVLDQLLSSEDIQVVQTNICKSIEENTPKKNSDTVIGQNEIVELSRSLEIDKENAPILVVSKEVNMLPLAKNAGEHVVKNCGSTRIILLDKSNKDFSCDETYLKGCMTDHKLKESDNEFRDTPVDNIFIDIGQPRERFYDEVVKTDEGEKEQTTSTSSCESVGEYQLEDILEGLSEEDEGETKTSLSRSHCVSEKIGHEGEEMGSKQNYFEFSRPFQDDSNVFGSTSIIRVDQGDNSEVFRLLQFDQASSRSKQQELSILCSEHDDIFSTTEPSESHFCSLDGLSIYRSPVEAFGEKPMNMNGHKVIQDVSNQLFCYNEEQCPPNIYYNSYPLVLESPKGELIFEGESILSGRESLCTDQSGDVEVTGKEQEEGLMILADDDLPEQESPTENTEIERGLNVIHRRDFGMHRIDFQSDTDDSSSSGTSCSSTSGSFECFNLKFKDWKIEKVFKEKNQEDELEKEDEDMKLSTWDRNATPTRSAFLSTEKKLLGMKKSVSFHEDYPMLVYNYPPEIESNDNVEDDIDDAEEFCWKIDYENYADWDIEREVEECFKPLVSTHQEIRMYPVTDDILQDVPKIATEKFVQDFVGENKNLVREGNPCFKESLSYSNRKNKDVLSEGFFISCKPGSQYSNEENRNQFYRSGADTSGSVALSYIEDESSSLMSQEEDCRCDESRVVTEAYNSAIMTVHGLEFDSHHLSYDHMPGYLKNSVCEESQSGVSYDFQPLSNLLTIPDELPNFVDAKSFDDTNIFKPLTSNDAYFECCSLQQFKEPIQNIGKGHCFMEENFSENREIGVERLKKESDLYSPNNELFPSDFHFEIADSDQEDFFKCDLQELHENCKEPESPLDEVRQSFTEGNIEINYKEPEDGMKLMKDRNIQSQHEEPEYSAESLTERNIQSQHEEPEAGAESLTERNSQSQHEEPEAGAESLTERNNQSQHEEPEAGAESLTERNIQSQHEEPKADAESLTERNVQSQHEEPEAGAESLTERNSQSQHEEPEYGAESLTERNSQSQHEDPECSAESLTERNSQSLQDDSKCGTESLTDRNIQIQQTIQGELEELENNECYQLKELKNLPHFMANKYCEVKSTDVSVHSENVGVEGDSDPASVRSTDESVHSENVVVVEGDSDPATVRSTDESVHSENVGVEGDSDPAGVRSTDESVHSENVVVVEGDSYPAGVRSTDESVHSENVVVVEGDSDPAGVRSTDESVHSENVGVEGDSDPAGVRSTDEYVHSEYVGVEGDSDPAGVRCTDESVHSENVGVEGDSDPGGVRSTDVSVHLENVGVEGDSDPAGVRSTDESVHSENVVLVEGDSDPAGVRSTDEYVHSEYVGVEGDSDPAGVRSTDESVHSENVGVEGDSDPAGVRSTDESVHSENVGVEGDSGSAGVEGDSYLEYVGDDSRQKTYM
ncbi:uncharacterized protein LOC111089522 [Limulus polyphemus]|uniref:Uncharacterized protein LOC111089522 n=1 Tax=Limulus polyphemus TaxID=6850 RepID=A0ABM1TPS4_LIMPO|nr:uncharacterized protein LOC111089522 [Limulus polyphemus]